MSETNKYGELSIPLPNGGTLCCGRGSGHYWGGFLCIRDEKGDELIAWDASEWEEDPEGVIGAVMAMAAGPMKAILAKVSPAPHQFRVNDFVLVKKYAGSNDDCGRICYERTESKGLEYYVSSANMPFCGSIGEWLVAGELEPIKKWD